MAFAYTVFDIADARCLGCMYINPPTKPGYDAEVFLWVRHSLRQEQGVDWDGRLETTVRRCPPPPPLFPCWLS